MFSKTGIEKSTKGKDYKTLKGWNYGKYAWITVNAKLKSTLPSYFMHFFSHLLTILFLFPIIPEWVLVKYKHIKGLIISELNNLWVISPFIWVLHFCIPWQHKPKGGMCLFTVASEKHHELI